MQFFDDRFQAEALLCLEAVIKPAWNLPVPNVQ